MSIKSVMPSSHLILCPPLLLLPSIFSSIRVFSDELVPRIRWPKYWSFSFSISPSNEYSGFISFRINWLDLLAVQGTLKSLLQHHSSKASILQHSAFFMVQLSHPYMTTGKTIALTIGTFVSKVMSLLFFFLYFFYIYIFFIIFSPFSEHAPSPSSQNSDCAVVTSSSTIYLFFYFIFYQLLFTLSPSFLSCYAVALLFYFFGRGSLFYFIFSICLCFLICCLDLSYFSSKEQASFNFVAAVTLNMAWGHSGLMDTSRCWESGAPREGIEVSCRFPHTLLLVGCF